MSLEPTNLLVIDTSTDQPAIALMTDDGRRQSAAVDGRRRHGRDLVPALRDLLAGARLPAVQLRVIAVGLGPGSYTGLRIGLTAARTLAYAARAGLIGLDSLEGWTRTATPGAPRVHVVADAQRGDVYTADFSRAAHHEPLVRASASRIEPMTVWRARLEGPAVVVGPGLDSPAIRAAVPAGVELGPDPQMSSPARALALLDLAIQSWAAGHRDDLWTLEPRYLRRSAAEDQWDARAMLPAPIKAAGGP